MCVRAKSRVRLCLRTVTRKAWTTDWSDTPLQLVLMYERCAAPRHRRLVGRSEVCQRNDFDGIFVGAMSFAGVVELGLGATLAFVSVVLWKGPPKSVSSLRPGSSAPGLLEAERWQRGVGLLILRQGRRHPAVVRMAQDEALLRAGFGGFSQGFLEIHFDSWEGGRRQEVIRALKTDVRRESRLTKQSQFYSNGHSTSRPAASEKV